MLPSVGTQVVIVAATLLCACVTDPSQIEYSNTRVRPEECAEIKTAIRKITSSSVISCSRAVDSYGRGPVDVFTTGETYRATKIHGKWHFEKVVIVI